MALQALPAHLVLADMHARLLRGIAAGVGLHFSGLAQAARHLRTAGIIDTALATKLRNVDFAHNLVRHLTQPGADDFIQHVLTLIPVDCQAQHDQCIASMPSSSPPASPRADLLMMLAASSSAPPSAVAAREFFIGSSTSSSASISDADNYADSMTVDTVTQTEQDLPDIADVTADHDVSFESDLVAGDRWASLSHNYLHNYLILYLGLLRIQIGLGALSRRMDRAAIRDASRTAP